MSNIIVNVPNNERIDGMTQDAKKYNKDCPDFQCLDDGTVLGECKYCNLSTVCRQIGILPNGEMVPMEGHFLPVIDENGQLVAHEIFCTGMIDHRPHKERIEDDSVS